MAGAAYTAANVVLPVVPDMSGFFAEMDRRIRGYHPPDVTPRVEPEVDDEPAADDLEQSARGGGLAAAALAAGAVLGMALGSAIGNALDLQKTQSRLAAQLGDTNAIGAERAGKIAGQLYAGAWGESMGEVSDVVSQVVRSGVIAADATDETIKGISASFLDLAATYDVDIQRAIEATSAMVRNGVVPNAETAQDVITALYRDLGTGADDVLDTFQEYSVQFSKVGLDAQTVGGLVSQMFRAGARDTDIAADALKEFSIRSIDGSKTTVAGYQLIGLNADDMRRRIAAGGPDATKAFGEVVTALKTVKDPAIQAEAAVNLFGTQAEDLGQALYAMDPTNAVNAMQNVEGAAVVLGDSLNDNAGVRIESFKRTLELTAVDIIGGKVIPALEFLIDGLEDVLAVPGVPEVLGFIFSAGAGIAITLGVIAGAIKVWTGVQWLWNAALAASPLTWVAIVLGALVGALIYAYNTSEDFRRIVDGVFAWVGGAAQRLGVAFDTTMDSVMTIFGAVGDFFTMVWVDYIKPIFDRFPGVVQTTADSLRTIWDTIKKIFGSPVYFVLETVWNQGIGGLWDKAKSFGLPLGDFARVPTDGIPRFRDGGRVPGTSPTRTADDRVIRATSGEWIHPVDAVDYYGDDVMDRIRRRAIPREQLAAYALGGKVGDVIGQGSAGATMGPSTPQQMLAVLSRALPGTRLTSGLRPGDPGFHGRNRAGDFAGARAGDTAAMAAINRWIAGAFPNAAELIYTPGINLKNGRPHTYSPAVRADHYDHVHWANLGGASAGGSRSLGSASATVTDWFTQQVRDLFDTAAVGVRNMVTGAFPPNGTFVGDLPVKGTDWAIGKARDFLFGKARAEDDKAAAMAASSGGGNVAQWTGVVQQALGLLGLSPTLVATTLRRMNQESGGNPRAINLWDSNAKKGIPSKGLMQVIDPTFRAYHDSRTSNDIYDPLANVVASMKYALARYGSLPRAYDRAGGYDTGGELFPGDTLIHNRLPHSETVVPLPPKLVADLLARGRGGDGAAAPAVAIEHAHFADPVDVDLLMQRVDHLSRNGGM